MEDCCSSRYEGDDDDDDDLRIGLTLVTRWRFMQRKNRHWDNRSKGIVLIIISSEFPS